MDSILYVWKSFKCLDLFLIKTDFLRAFDVLGRKPKTTIDTTKTTTTSTTISNIEDNLKLHCSEEKVRDVLRPATKAGELSQMAWPNRTSGDPVVLYIGETSKNSTNYKILIPERTFVCNMVSQPLVTTYLIF